MSSISRLSVEVSVSADHVRAEIVDGRPNTISLFGELSDSQRQQLAHDAWSVGFQALGSAYAQAQEARLQDVGQALLEGIGRHLAEHVEQQQRTMAAVLESYFNPQDGQVAQRVRAFVDDEGVLARLLQKYLGPQNSVLAETLARQVGEQSPLFKKLNPSDSESVVKTIELQLRNALDSGHAELVRALDPLAQDGAVARFLRSLREELKNADEDRAKQLGVALAALDANDDSSLICRLMRETRDARQALLQAVNPDAPDSAMAAIKQALSALIKDQAVAHREALKQQEERQARLEKEIREALGRLEARREQDKKSPRGGLDFEQAVSRFVAAAVDGAPCVVDLTGSTVGARRSCKVGDLVVRFTSESAFHGSAVVFEAKRDASYTVQRALEELDVARANREASAAVFVMAQSHAPVGFPRFARFGKNVLLTWDDSDKSSDPYLHAGLLLGLALVTRTQSEANQGDLDAMRDIEERVEAEVVRLDRMQKNNEGIRRHSDTIGDEIRKAHDQLGLLLRNARKVLAALATEVLDEEAERRSPITLPTAAIERGSDALARVELAVDGESPAA